MEKKFFEIPEFTNEILEEIRRTDIEAGGEERRKLWEEGKINIDYLKESYNRRKAYVDSKRLIAEGKEPIKFETPLFHEVHKKFEEANDISEESIERYLGEYHLASSTAMKFFVRKFNEFRLLRDKENQND